MNSHTMNLNSFAGYIQNEHSLIIDCASQIPSDKAIEKSFSILKHFETSSLYPSSVNPSIESGIGISFDFPKVFAYIEVLNSEEIVFLIDNQGPGRQVWETIFNNELKIEESIQTIIKHLTKE